MQAIAIPKLNASDDQCVLVEWTRQADEFAPAGIVIATVETSKATNEILAPIDGILLPIHPVGAELPFGTVIGYLFGSAAEKARFLEGGARPGQTAGRIAPAFQLTKEAARIVHERQIPPEELTRLGKPLIRASDLEALGRQPKMEGEVFELSRRQRSIGSVVRRAHESIPSAALFMRMDVDHLLGWLRKRSQEADVRIGPLEFIVQAVARLRGSDPLLFAKLSGDACSYTVVEDPGVGVTFDTGNGLFIPVVREPASKSLAEIAEILIDFRAKALKGRFDSRDMAEGDITISLNVDRDAMLSLPLIVPGQTAIVSLSGLLQEVRLDAGGRPYSCGLVIIGLTYDHRMVNGHEATQFLKSLKISIERPESGLSTA